MSVSFFAAISRMKYINRWALMRNAREESLSEHSCEVAVIAHALCVIGNVRFGKQYDAERAAVLALYHDAPEIITGDMPTPVKYLNPQIREAYRQVEEGAEEKLLSTLPEDLRGAFAPLLCENDPADAALLPILKAADKLSALIKCVEEDRSGNREFDSARLSTEAALRELTARVPEADVFVKECLPAYGRTLDELFSGQA